MPTIGEYAAMAKNLRCILATDDGGIVKFLRRFHRYRGVGVPQHMPLPEGKCFVHLQPPPGLEEIYASLSSIDRVLMLSATYMAPIIATTNDIPDYIDRGIPIHGQWSKGEVLRHIRIAEYSIIDSAIKDHGDFEDFVKNDMKRFWRITRGDDTIGLYAHVPLDGYPDVAIVLFLQASSVSETQ